MSTQTQPELMPQPFVTVSPFEADLGARAASLVGQVDRLPATIEDESMAAAATSLDSLLAQAVKSCDEHEKQLTSPWKGLVAAAKARFDSIRDPLKFGRQRLNTPLLAWEKEKRRRADAEAAALRKRIEDDALAAAQKAEEEAKASKTAGDADMAEVSQAVADNTLDSAVRATEAIRPVVAPTRGVIGGTSHLADHWTFEVVSIAHVPEKYLKPREVSTASVLAEAKRQREAGNLAPTIAGLRIFNDVQRRTRR